MADKKRVSWLCKLGMHKWRPLALTSILMPIPVEECKRCGVGRQFSAYGGLYTYDLRSMDNMRKDLAKKAEGMARIENEREGKKCS